jgi:tetratricopeptide (TPR) repeat protein
MYIRPRRKQRANLWPIIFLLFIIASGLYLYTVFRTEEIESSAPATPTPLPTRSAFSFTTEAEGLYVEGDMEGAIAAYEQAIELEPENHELYVPLSRLLVLQGHFDEGIGRAEQAVALAPESAPAWAALCMAYDWDGQVTPAIEACRQAVELDPAYALGYAYLGEAYADASRWNEALEAAERAVELDPHNVDVRRDHAYVLEQMGYWDAALEEFEEATEIHPNLPHLYVDIGRCHLYLINTPSAIRSFTRAVELDPDYVDALDRLGRAYYAIEAYGEAQDYLERAIEADPEYAPAYAHLAYTFWSMQNYHSAIPNFETAIELSYRASRRNARGFLVTVEWAEGMEDYASPETVLRGELEWADEEHTLLVASLQPETSAGRWEAAGGQVTLDAVSGAYTVTLENMPTLPLNQVYVGWFDRLWTLEGLPLHTGPLRPEDDGSLERHLVAKPVWSRMHGPEVAYFHDLGRCYYFVERCDLAYPLFDLALQMEPENEFALDGIRRCREAEDSS